MNTSRRRRQQRAAAAVAVAVLALLAVACGSSSVPESSGGAPAKSASVTIKNVSFQPPRVQVKAGDSVTWHFDDAQVPHTVTAADASFDSGVMTSGTFTHRFEKPGTYDYTCTIHPQMKATIVVS